MRVFVFGLVLLLGVIASACGHTHASTDTAHNEMSMQPIAPSTDGAIDVHLVNWAIEVASTTVPAGKVTFRAIHDAAHMHMANEGGMLHDLAVARKQGEGTFVVLGQVTGIGMGQAKDLSLKLDPGDYELQCNYVEDVGKGKMLSHYIQGMHTEFHVQ